MSAGHAIEVLSFEVAFATEGQARAQHMRVGDFAAGRGLAVIEEVFDEFAGAAHTIRLDSLEVDLGETPEDWDDAEAEARLREALRRALRAAIGPRPESGARAAVSDAPAAADLEAVWRHLDDGVLPWNLTSLDRDAFAALVRRVVAGHGAALADRLRRAPAPLQARMIARLARQWPRGATETLAQRLGADPERLAALPPPATAPDAWTEQLAAGIGAPPGWSADAAVVPASLDEAAWPRLINGEPAAVRARLTALGRHPENRARLAALLTDARQRQVLSLWAATPDVDFLQALFAAPQAWRMGGSAGEAERLRTLREGLLAYVLTLPGETLDVAAAVEAMVTARARADGLAPSRVARALVAGWPGEGPAAAAHPRLRAALSSRGLVTGPDPASPEPVGRKPVGPAPADASPRSGTSPSDDASIQHDRPPSAPGGEASDMPGPEPHGWRFEVGAPGDPATGEPSHEAESAWTRRVRLEPAGLADQLRRLGRTAAARRRLAQDLTPARLADVLALWTEPADAAVVLAVIADAAPWVLGGPHALAHMAQRLRQWLLDTLLTAPPGPPRTAADLILALVRRRAAHDDLPFRSVAASLLQPWPTDAAVRDRLRHILAGAAAEPQERTPDVDVTLSATASGPPSPDATPPPSSAHHVTPAASSPSPDLADVRATLLTALANRDTAAAEPLLRRLLTTDRPWLDASLREHARDRSLIDALANALPPALLFDLAQPHLSEPALRLLLVTAPNRDAATLWADVLTTLWSDTPAGPVTAAALARRLRRTGDAATFATRLRAAGAYLRDTPPATLSTAIDSPGAAPPTDLASWRGRLPQRPSAAAIRAISALLAPAATGLRALATYTDAERHNLILSLRPADAPAALAAIRMLTAAADAAALSPPPEGWSTFGWRAVLRDLFEEERPFEAAGFARRWFDAWAAATPPGAAEAARARLASTLDTLPIDRGLPVADTDQAAAQPPGPRYADVTPPDPPEARQPRSDTPPSDVTGAAPIPPPHRPDQDASTDAGQSPTEPPSRAGLSATAAPRAADQPPATHTTSASDPTDGDVRPPASTDAPQPTPPRAGTEPVPLATAALDTPAAPGAPSADGLRPLTSTPQPTTAAPAAQSPDQPPPADAPDPRDLAAALRPAAPTDADPAPAEPDTDRVVYVDNAGLVLAGPFIPALFSRLELTRAGGFVDERARERAIHILQFLVDGDADAAPEHRLALNKLVCGLDFAIPIGRDFRITDPERATVEDLLRVMVQRWPALGRTSIAGLRETFLIRRGALRPQDDTWRLTIEPGPFDMLLDQLPWGYGVLKSPWMTQVLHVDWR